jgi:uncharacterized protein YyaL (SSP411 family)
MNRLQHETSPYLLQHAANPVDWYPWGAEAFEQAQREDKPILLSVGYSACHWCHVMAHESFEHEATARLMNQLYVNIKVDREERPDVDDIYMQAVQAMTGHGGWPMTVFLLPDGRPFYGGTYFPPTPRPGMPAFREVLAAVAEAYQQRRADVEQAADSLTGSLQRDLLNLGSGSVGHLDAGLLDTAYAQMARRFDPDYGGFGGAPKFPQPMNLDFLLRTHARSGTESARDMALFTLAQMARGGMYDQVGGGFHRYSVDARWLVPHFEKMLYDNAQLSRVYLHAWQLTGEPFYRHIAEEIYDYILREMADAEGGFYSATDADSEGEEGRFFVWDQAELEALLGADAEIALEYWGVTAGGNFEGHNILYVPLADSAVAARLGLTADALRAKLAAIKDTLYAARAQRVAPGLDDKIVTAWNGLMLASLAEAARVLGREDYRAAAVRAGEFVLRALVAPDGGLFRTWKRGQAKIAAYLEDYAAVVDALLELYQTTFEPRWFEAARRLADYALDHFAAADGGFYDTADHHETLIVRPRNPQDNATPSGGALLTRQLVRLAAYTGDARYDTAAQTALAGLTEAFRQFPQAFAEWLNALDMFTVGLAEVAVVGDPADARTAALLDVVRGPYRPNVITALAPTDVDDAHPVALLHGRTLRDGAPAAYVCRHFVCQMPVTTPDALRALLDKEI